MVIQQAGPEWFSTATESERTHDGITFRMRDVSRPAPGLLAATMEYVIGDQRWTQTFTSRKLGHGRLAEALGAARLRLDRYLTDDRAWFRAVPEPG